MREASQFERRWRPFSGVLDDQDDDGCGWMWMWYEVEAICVFCKHLFRLEDAEKVQKSALLETGSGKNKKVVIFAFLLQHYRQYPAKTKGQFRTCGVSLTTVRVRL